MAEWIALAPEREKAEQARAQAEINTQRAEHVGRIKQLMGTR